MATVNKDFRVKAGLVVEGSTATVNGHDVITEAVVDAKGDLIVASGEDAVTRLAVGTDNYVLTADSNATNGVAWKAPAAVGEFGSSITFEGATANDFETTVQVTDPTGDRTITFPDATGTVALTSDIPSSTDGLSEGSTNKYFTDERAQDAVGNAVGTGLTYTDSTGAIAVDTTTIQARVANVSDTEIGYLDGVTSAIQTQLNAKAPTESPTFTGTVVLPSTVNGPSISTSVNLLFPTQSGNITLGGSQTTGSLTIGGGAGRTTGAVNIATGATTTGTKTVNVGTGSTGGTTEVTIGSSSGATSNVTINGNVTLPSTTSIGDVSSTELSYVNGVTSAIQTQLDAKFATANASTSNISEGTNLYFTDERAQDAVGSVVGNGLDYDDTSGAISVDPSEFALSAVGAPTGNVSMATYKITSLGTPTDSTDAATKAYVDSVTEGLHIHESARAATTANVNLANALENGDTLDGVTLATGDRVLVKNQTTQSENGIYVVQASGQPTRATDFDTATEVDSGDFVFVYAGTVNASTGWVQTNKPATIGTDAIVFTQFSGAGTYLAGNGLTLTGNTFTIDTTITADLSTSQTLTNKTISGSSNTLSNIGNSSLTNSAITINGTSVSLGGTRTLGSDDISEGSTNKYFTDERAQDAVGNAVGTGLSYNDGTGAISNSGVLSITGTANQITASASSGAITLSGPQDLHSAATPTFGSVTVGSVTLADALVGSALATAGTSATTIDTWSASTYSAAKYIVQMKKSGNIEVIEMLVAVDGDNNVYVTEYANVQSNGELGTTNAVYSGGNVLLQVTAAAADTSVKVSKTYIEA